MPDTLNLTPEQRERLKRDMKEGFIYQRLRHDCGYVGNSFHKPDDGKWKRRTHCPQCKKEITWISMEEWLKKHIFGENHES